MKVETKTTTDKIEFEIPFKYYRALARLRHCVDIGLTAGPTMRPITPAYTNTLYRTIMEDLLDVLYADQRAGAFNVIGRKPIDCEHKVTLEKTDNPFGCFWTDIVLAQLSEKYGFGGLWDAWRDDP